MATLAMQGKQNISEGAVKKFVELGLQDGTLYSTIDGDHLSLMSDM